MKIRIDDEKIENHWECKECNEETTVFPTFYEEAGTPVCPKCGMDMEYSHTEVDISII